MSENQLWLCTACWVENPVQGKYCTTPNCKKWRPQSAIPVRKGDWRCCGEVQFASRSSCRRCGKDKPAGADQEVNKKRKVSPETHSGVARALITFRKGDWLCRKCHDHQFAKNAFCRKCGDSRPAREDEAGNDIDDPCAICFDRIKNAGFLHGGDIHVLSCKECADGLKAEGKKCPMCRQEIEKVLRVFF